MGYPNPVYVIPDVHRLLLYFIIIFQVIKIKRYFKTVGSKVISFLKDKISFENIIF